MSTYSIQLVALLVYGILDTGYAGFVLKSFDDCDAGTDYPLKLDVVAKTADGKQLINVDVDSPVPFDDNLALNITVDAVMEADKSAPIRLLNNVEKNACTTLHKYFGAVVNKVEKKMNLEPGKCPIPKGKYLLSDYPIELDKLPITQMFPVGEIRGRVEAIHVKDDKVMFCKVIRLVQA